MSSFKIGFLEEFVLLLLSGTFLGLCLYVSTRFLVRWARGKTGFLAATGPMALLALFFFYISIPRIRAAALEGLPYFLTMGLCAAVGIAFWGGRGRGFLGKSVAGILFASAAAILLTFSIFQFVTAGHTTFGDGDLIALVAVTPEQLPPGTRIENDAVSVEYASDRPVAAVRMQLHYLEDGKPAPPFHVTLPGEKWGVGGQILRVHNWFFLFGERTLCRLTGVDAQFEDLEIATVGMHLPSYDPDAQPLETEIPLFNRKLRELCNVETTQLEYDQFIYQHIDAGRYFGIYIHPGGGFVPKPLSTEEFLELRRSKFDFEMRLL